MFRWTSAIAGFVSLVMLSGCGESYSPDAGVIVTGKVVQGGAPVPVPPTDDGYDGVEVQFFGADPNNLTLATSGATCDAAGNFEIAYAGEGIPPGKYKVAIFVRKGGPETDMLEGKLANGVTTIEFDIPADKVGGKHDVGTIDIATYAK